MSTVSSIRVKILYFESIKCIFRRSMAQIHNEIGALADLKAKLRSKGIYEFGSLQNILDFLKEFPQKKNQIILEHSKKIQSEKNQLIKDRSSAMD